MSFPESTKLLVKQKAHFTCCLCHGLGVEVHHILPESEDGPDSEDNAAPLCPSCHEIYGGNPQKRKFIKEARDFWYELCERRYAADAAQFQQILAAVRGVATRNDLQDLATKFSEFQQNISSSLVDFANEVRLLSPLEKSPRVQNCLATHTMTVSQLRKREAVAKAATEAVLSIVENIGPKYNTTAAEAVCKTLTSLKGLGNLSDADIRRILQTVSREEPEPVNEREKVVYYLSALYKAFIRVHTTLSISAFLPPLALEHFDKDPNLSIEELIRLSFEVMEPPPPQT